MTLLFTQGHNCVSNLKLVMLKIVLTGIVCQLWHARWHDGTPMHGISAHARFDDLDGRSQWVGKGKNSVFNYFDNYASNKH